MLIFNALQTSLSGGIGRYSYELANSLYKLNIDMKIVIRREDIEEFSFVKEKDLIIAEGIKNSKDRNKYEQFVLPKIVSEKYPDAILHYPDTMAPLMAKNKVVITVHDLAFKSLKKVFTWKTVLWKNFITNLSIKKAERIIAITNFTKEEIVSHYPSINKDKISVIYNGFNDFTKEAINFSKIKGELKSLENTKYILTVSTISPRKNIDGLIRAYSTIMDKIPCKLVVCGNNGWMYENVHSLVEELNIKERVIFTGKVNDEELKFLYKNAEVFVYPSFYEGFGLPPLEAMSYGVPCVVSNTSSLPEVVGNPDIQVNPHDEKEIAEKIYELISPKEKRQLAIEKGTENLKRFSWMKTAEMCLKIYEDIAK